MLVLGAGVQAGETPADHRQAMRVIGAGVQAMLQPGATDDLEFAGRIAPALRDALATVERFWIGRDPLALTHTGPAIKAVQDLDVALEFGSIEGVVVAMKDLQCTCAACHAATRASAAYWLRESAFAAEYSSASLPPAHRR